MKEYFVLAVCWKASGRWTFLSIHGNTPIAVLRASALVGWTQSDYDNWKISKAAQEFLIRHFNAWKLIPKTEAETWDFMSIHKQCSNWR